MKKSTAVILLLAIAMAWTSGANAQSKQDMHISYVLKNAKLGKDTSARLKPLLVAYYKDMAAAKASHKELKDKLNPKENAGKLTEAECDRLFESKQKQEAAELAVAKKHYAIFKSVLTTQQAYRVIKLCDDKVK